MGSFSHTPVNVSMYSLPCMCFDGSATAIAHLPVKPIGPKKISLFLIAKFELLVMLLSD